jgi:hypothetical protein
MHSNNDQIYWSLSAIYVLVHCLAMGSTLIIPLSPKRKPCENLYIAVVWTNIDKQLTILDSKNCCNNFLFEAENHLLHLSIKVLLLSYQTVVCYISCCFLMIHCPVHPSKKQKSCGTSRAIEVFICSYVVTVYCKK